MSSSAASKDDVPKRPSIFGFGASGDEEKPRSRPSFFGGGNSLGGEEARKRKTSFFRSMSRAIGGDGTEGTAADRPRKPSFFGTVMTTHSTAAEGGRNVRRRSSDKLRPAESAQTGAGFAALIDDKNRAAVPPHLCGPAGCRSAKAGSEGYSSFVNKLSSIAAEAVRTSVRRSSRDSFSRNSRTRVSRTSIDDSPASDWRAHRRTPPPIATGDAGDDTGTESFGRRRGRDPSSKRGSVGFPAFFEQLLANPPKVSPKPSPNKPKPGR
eukprot:6753299-Prymnesium_polylepis.2